MNDFKTSKTPLGKWGHDIYAPSQWTPLLLDGPNLTEIDAQRKWMLRGLGNLRAWALLLATDLVPKAH